MVRLLADRSAAEYGDAHWVAWLARFEPDDANLTAAVEWAVRDGAGEVAGRLTWGLWWYWWSTASLSAGLGALERDDYHVASRLLRSALARAEKVGSPGRGAG